MKIKWKITSPKEMGMDKNEFERQVNELIGLFENGFKNAEKGKSCYVITAQGLYNELVLKKVVNIYKKNGWSNVHITYSEYFAKHNIWDYTLFVYLPS